MMASNYLLNFLKSYLYTMA